MSKGSTSREKRRAAIEALGINEESFCHLPDVSMRLRDLMRRHAAVTGRKQETSITMVMVVRYLLYSEAKEAIAVVEKYKSIPARLRNSAPLEAYCFAAGVSALRLSEIIVGIMYRLGTEESSIIAAAGLPNVVKKSVDVALTDAGVEDRSMLFKATGFLPAPKGAQTIVNVAANAQAQANAQSAAIAAPVPESTIKRLTDRFHAARGIAPAPVPAALPAASEVEEIPVIMPAAAVVPVAVRRPFEEEEASD